ncbi:hypothetical protein [Actinocorallia lasiicapitis]
MSEATTTPVVAGSNPGTWTAARLSAARSWAPNELSSHLIEPVKKIVPATGARSAPTRSISGSN